MALGLAPLLAKQPQAEGEEHRSEDDCVDADHPEQRQAARGGAGQEQDAEHDREDARDPDQPARLEPLRRERADELEDPDRDGANADQENEGHERHGRIGERDDADGDRGDALEDVPAPALAGAPELPGQEEVENSVGERVDRERRSRTRSQPRTGLRRAMTPKMTARMPRRATAHPAWRAVDSSEYRIS